MASNLTYAELKAVADDEGYLDWLEEEFDLDSTPQPTVTPVIPEIKTVSDITMLDLFCGSGGSSSGARRVGIDVKHAANHWDLAINVHQLNHPGTDHSRADITDTNPRFFPSTDILWASPECTNHSLAKGVRRRTKQMELGSGTGEKDIPAERSRVMMNDVPRFMEYAKRVKGKPYKYVVVENVVDVATWDGFDAWTKEITNLGYNYKVVSLNTAFAHSVDNFGTPQSRDRVFVVCWDQGIPAPDLDFRPAAYCDSCDDVVGGVQTFKPGRTVGKYNQQYTYTCENMGCAKEVQPFALPVASVLDFSRKAPLIGERKKPLATKTRARIWGGLEQHGASLIAQVGASTFERRPGVRTRPITEPAVAQTATASGALVDAAAIHASMVVPNHGRTNNGEVVAFGRPTDQVAQAQTTRQEFGIATIPAQLIPSGGTWRTEATSVNDLAPTRTTTESDGVLLPGQALQITLRGGGSQGRGFRADEPTGAVSAGGINTGVVFPGGTDGVRYADTVRYQKPDGKFEDLQVPPSWLDQFNKGCGLIDTERPANTVTTVDRFGLVIGQARWRAHLEEIKRGGGQIEVTNEMIDSCGYRMVSKDETGRIQGFDKNYQMLGTNRQQVRMHGNAVPPPASELILGACIGALYPEMGLDRRMRVEHSLATVSL